MTFEKKMSIFLFFLYASRLHQLQFKFRDTDHLSIKKAKNKLFTFQIIIWMNTFLDDNFLGKNKQEYLINFILCL
jgi:hypothetical protein